MNKYKILTEVYQLLNNKLFNNVKTLYIMKKLIQNVCASL